MWIIVRIPSFCAFGCRNYERGRNDLLLKKNINIKIPDLSSIFNYWRQDKNSYIKNKVSGADGWPSSTDDQLTDF